MKRCEPFQDFSGRKFYIPMDNGRSLGTGTNGNPCSFKPTTSSLNWSEGFSSVGTRYQPSQNHSISYSSFDKQFLERTPTTYVRPDFVFYTPPSQPFIPEPKYIPSVVNKPPYYTTGDNYVIQELTTNLHTLQNLVCMDFTGKQLGSDSCRVLNEAFRNAKLPYLLTLVLTNNQIDDVGATYLVDAIGRGFVPNLSSLFIDNNNLTCKGKETLVKTACQIKWKQKISVTVDYGIVFPNQQTDLIASNWCALQQKYSKVDIGYGKVHTHPIIGGSFYYRGIPFMNEVVDTVKEEVISKTLYQKIVINGYNRELVDSDLYYLGFSLSGSTNPITSGVNLNLLLLDLHKNNIAAPGIYNFVHFFKGQNIREVNLSNNQIGDEGAKLLADSLLNGRFPHLKTLRLEGNKITDKGETALIKAMKGQVQDIVVLTNKINMTDKIISGTKEERIAIYKDLIEKGKAKGTYDAGLVIDKSFLGEIKNLANISKVTFQAAIGFAKCHFSPDDVAVGYAQDSIIAKLPNMLSKTAQYFTKIVNVKNIGECYVYVTEDGWTSEVGQQVVKHDLCLAGETEFCGE